MKIKVYKFIIYRIFIQHIYFNDENERIKDKFTVFLFEILKD